MALESSGFSESSVSTAASPTNRFERSMCPSASPASAPKGTTWNIEADDEGTRLDKWLADPQRLGSRSRAKAALERGKVYLNEEPQSLSDAPRQLTVGQTVRLWKDRPGSSKKLLAPDRRVAGLQIVREDDDVMVVDKPAGLLTVRRSPESREPTLLSKVERYLDTGAKRKAYVVHRIDRLTTGTVVVAKNRRAQDNLKDQFYRRQPTRCYWALVEGLVRNDSGTWRAQLVDDSSSRIQRAARDKEQSKEAISHYKVVERFQSTTLLEVHLETGKRNQIRIQGSLQGHPLVGERIYLPDENYVGSVQFPRQALHALRITFKHPRTEESWTCEAPLPDDFQALLGKLRRQKGAAVEGPLSNVSSPKKVAPPRATPKRSSKKRTPTPPPKQSR